MPSETSCHALRVCVSKDCTKLAATEELAAAEDPPGIIAARFACKPERRQHGAPSAVGARRQNGSQMVQRALHANASSASPSQCWGTGVCDDPQSSCYVKYKTDHGGYAQCRRSCPSDWNCEKRTPQGCGAAALPASLPPAPFSEAKSLLAEFPGAALCDRRNPPAGAEISRFEMLCYDGGQTGNRYLMVKHMLRRAVCRWPRRLGC